MNITQLKTLVKKGESETLEFKNSTGSLKAGMQTLCAFLNSDRGGKVIFGVEEPAIPYNVLREAVTNALVHRDYSYDGGSMDIAAYYDRLNISNSGALPQGVKLNELSKEHRSVLRNPRIANVFYLCGNIEKWGRGTLDMIQDCKAAGNPAPIYKELSGSFSVTLPFRTPIFPTSERPQKINHSELSIRQKKIISDLRNGPLTRPQIMKKIKVLVTDRAIQLDLIKLKEVGLVTSEGSTKAKIWSMVVLQ